MPPPLFLQQKKSACCHQKWLSFTNYVSDAQTLTKESHSLAILKIYEATEESITNKGFNNLTYCYTLTINLLEVWELHPQLCKLQQPRVFIRINMVTIMPLSYGSKETFDKQFTLLSIMRIQTLKDQSFIYTQSSF